MQAKPITSCALSFAVLISTAATSWSAITSGAGESFGLRLGLDTLTLVSLGVTDPSAVEDTAPAPYTLTDTDLGVSGLTLNLASVSTGVITNTATSNVDGTAGSKLSVSTSTVNNVNLEVFALVFPALDLGATTITSSSSVTGDYGSYVSTGNSVIEGLTISVFGESLDITAEALTTPNFLLYSGLGITITLNEQITTGNGVSGRGIETNAIHISIDALDGLLTGIDGDVVIGHSFASLEGIPEPSSLLLGLAGSLIFFRRKRTI